MKKHQLLNYENEIKEWRSRGSVLLIFNKGRIADFYKENKIALDCLFDDIDGLRKVFFVHDENGVIQFEGEGSDRKPLYQDDKNPNDFTKNWSRLMNQEILEKFKVEFDSEKTEEEKEVPVIKLEEEVAEENE